jgi:ornithine cyclodeaminase/alanine dehydrogenase-like protein (mu-crystallin family)
MGVRCGPNFTGGKGSVAILYGIDGELLSLLAYPFSTLRVGAAAAISIKYMARPDACRVGLVGSGKLALSILRGTAAVRNVTEIAVYSRDRERRGHFCVEASAALNLTVRPVDTVEEAVAGRDIVLTASSSRAPLFPFSWLAKGTHVSSMGPISELHADILAKADRLAVGSKQQEKDYYMPAPPFPLVELIDAGTLSWDQVAELGEIVLGRKPGRAREDEITVFHESQGGFGDVAFASYVYDEARRRGVGQEFAF